MNESDHKELVELIKKEIIDNLKIVIREETECYWDQKSIHLEVKLLYHDAVISNSLTYHD